VQYDFIADLDKSGTCKRLEGNVKDALGGAVHRFVNRPFMEYVVPEARAEMTETLKMVQGNAVPIRIGVTLIGGDGSERPFMLDVVAVSKKEKVTGLRIGGARRRIESGLDSHKMAEGLHNFRDTIAGSLSADDERVLTIYEIDHSQIGELAGDTGDGVVHLNENTAAVLHENSDAAARAKPGFSIKLATKDVGDSGEAMAMIDGMLAAAAMPEFTLQEGMRSLTDAYDDTIEAVAEMKAAPPPIRYASMRGDADNKLGICDYAELLAPHEGGSGAGSKLIETVVRNRLSQTASARKEGVPVCVPIHAASLLLLDDADWAAFDLMVMPKGLKHLPPESQLAVTKRLTEQQVMADIRDMAAVPGVFGELFQAKALTRLYVDPQVFFDCQPVERMAFWRLVADCAKRDVYAAFDGDSAVMISAMTSGFDTVYVFGDAVDSE